MKNSRYFIFRDIWSKKNQGYRILRPPPLMGPQPSEGLQHGGRKPVETSAAPVVRKLDNAIHRVIKLLFS